MTISELIKLFEKYNFKSVEKAKKAGLKLTYIGSGAFREAYRIGKLPVIVKFPYSSSEHSRREISIISKINRQNKYEYLRPYVPKIYYSNPKTGVIIMEQCKPFKSEITGKYELACKVLRDLVMSLFGPFASDDLYCSNLGYSLAYDKQLKILDFGLF